jgi:hypothetical protein
MARWKPRLDACEYAGIKRSKMDGLIGRGLVEARKEEGGPNASVHVNLDSYDAYIGGLRKAPGLRKIPNREREKRDLTQHP